MTQPDFSLSPEQVRQLPPMERIPYVYRIRILYPRINNILNELRCCIDSANFSDEPECKLLTGPPGSGKTTLLKIIMAEHPRQLTETGTLVPVLGATIDSPATMGSFVSRLLQGMGDPRCDKGLINNRIHRLEKFIDECRTKALLIDETQHFVDRDSKKVMQTVTDALKNLIKTKKLACILVGLENEAEQIVESNPQLARLFDDPLQLGRFEWSEFQHKSIEEFRTLLQMIEEQLPLQEESELLSDDLAYRIFLASDGLMAFIMKLIRESTVVALKKGQENLDCQLLSETFDKVLAKKRRGLNNPFVGNIPDYRSPTERRQDGK